MFVLDSNESSSATSSIDKHWKRRGVSKFVLLHGLRLHVSVLLKQSFEVEMLAVPGTQVQLWTRRCIFFSVGGLD